MDKSERFYVYLYRDPSRNNEPIYVGKGVGYRVTNHLRRKDTHPFVQRIQFMKKNGVEPNISFLCKDVDEELAFLVEEEAILLFGRKDLKTGCLLNLSAGGEGPSNPGPETRKKIGDATRGKSWTPEFRATMMAARDSSDWKTKIKAAASVNSKKNWENPEYRAKMIHHHAAMGKRKAKPCTIDGVNIFESRRQLIDTLGAGKNGSRSPNFRYVK